MSDYRPDIDGLRAIAVLSVVLYHAVEWVLPGGFIGVDVFFVISGYLITRLIHADMERGRFSIASFYVRRTKRIFPALFVVTFSTLALGLVLLSPTELAGFGRTMAATAGFVSNVIFWQDTGYFDTAAESKPLLHTWSLAVEEQFYLLWPLTLLLIRRTGWTLALTGTVALASCVAAGVLVARHQPTVFFLLPTRLWELLLGALLGLRYLRLPERPWLAHASAVLGLVLILTSLRTLSRDSLFPGWNALAPCIGTALLLASGERGETVVSRHLLTLRPMVFVGLISYSLYLWHWPLLAFARLMRRGELTTPEAGGVLAVAVGLAVLTWRFVETPLRVKGPTPRAAPVLTRYALLSAAALGVGLVLVRSQGLIARADPAMARSEGARYDVNPLTGPCLRWQSATGPLPLEPCLAGAGPSIDRMVIWGDSHADAAAPGFAALATGHRLASHQLTMAGCPPLAAVEVEGDGADYAPCAQFNRQVLDYIENTESVATVALVARWTLYTENTRFGADAGPITYLVDEQDRVRATDVSKRVFTRALTATVDRLRAAGKQVILLGSIPPLGVNVPECLSRNLLPLSGTRPCNARADVVLPHIAWPDEQVLRVADGRTGVCTYLPRKALCRDDTCISIDGDDILYANDDHLSRPGALFLAKHFAFDRCLPSGQATNHLP